MQSHREHCGITAVCGDGTESGSGHEIARLNCNAPIAQLAEAADLKSVKCRFESDWGHGEIVVGKSWRWALLLLAAQASNPTWRYVGLSGATPVGPPTPRLLLWPDKEHRDERGLPPNGCYPGKNRTGPAASSRLSRTCARLRHQCGASDLTLSPDDKYLYVSRNGTRGADVAVLDTTTGALIDVVDVSQAPGTTTQCVRMSPDGSVLYVGANGPSGGLLVVITTRAQSDGGRIGSRSRSRQKSSKPRGNQAAAGLRVVATIDIGSSVRDVALSPDGAIAYVASCGSDFGAVVDVIDTRTHQITSSRAISEIGGLVTRVSVSGDADRAYLVSEDRVTVLCTRTHDVIGTIRTGQPSCVVESPDGKYLYIADYSGTITRTAVASTIVSGTEQLALQRRGSMQWFSPELQQYAPALA